VVGVRPGSSGEEFDSPGTVPPPPIGTALPPPATDTAPNASVAPWSPAGGVSVTLLLPGISNGRAPPSIGEDEQDPRAMNAWPAYRSDVLCRRVATQPTSVPRLWYRNRCVSATRTACAQRASLGAPSVVPQSGGLRQEKGRNGRVGRSRDTSYGTRGPGSQADRSAKT